MPLTSILITILTGRNNDQFDMDLYFKLAEKITVYDARLVINRSMGLK